MWLWPKQTAFYNIYELRLVQMNNSFTISYLFCFQKTGFKTQTALYLINFADTERLQLLLCNLHTHFLSHLFYRLFDLMFKCMPTNSSEQWENVFWVRLSSKIQQCGLIACFSCFSYAFQLEPELNLLAGFELDSIDFFFYQDNNKNRCLCWLSINLNRG